MKKTFCFMVISTFLLCFASTPDQACPTGWQTASKNFSIYETSIPTWCNFTVTFCWMVDLAGIYHTVIVSCAFDEPCGSKVIQLQSTEFHQEEIKSVHQWFADNHLLPPCNGGGGGPAYYTVVVTSPQCMKIQNFGQTQTSLLLQCDDITGTCIAEYRICADYSFNPPHLGQYLVSYYGSDNSDCPLSTALPPLNKTFYDDWTSGCFMQACP